MSDSNKTIPQKADMSTSSGNSSMPDDDGAKNTSKTISSMSTSKITKPPATPTSKPVLATSQNSQKGTSITSTRPRTIASLTKTSSKPGTPVKNVVGGSHSSITATTSTVSLAPATALQLSQAGRMPLSQDGARPFQVHVIQQPVANQTLYQQQAYLQQQIMLQNAHLQAAVQSVNPQFVQVQGQRVIQTPTSIITSSQSQTGQAQTSKSSSASSSPTPSSGISSAPGGTKGQVTMTAPTLATPLIGGKPIMQTQTSQPLVIGQLGVISSQPPLGTKSQGGVQIGQQQPMALTTGPGGHIRVTCHPTLLANTGAIFAGPHMIANPAMLNQLQAMALQQNQTGLLSTQPLYIRTATPIASSAQGGATIQNVQPSSTVKVEQQTKPSVKKTTILPAVSRPAIRPTETKNPSQQLPKTSQSSNSVANRLKTSPKGKPSSPLAQVTMNKTNAVNRSRSPGQSSMSRPLAIKPKVTTATTVTQSGPVLVPGNSVVGTLAGPANVSVETQQVMPAGDSTSIVTSSPLVNGSLTARSTPMTVPHNGLHSSSSSSDTSSPSQLGGASGSISASDGIGAGDLSHEVKQEEPMDCLGAEGGEVHAAGAVDGDSNHDNHHQRSNGGLLTNGGGSARPRHILTHVIEGFVIQEGPDPFPVQRSSVLNVHMNARALRELGEHEANESADGTPEEEGMETGPPLEEERGEAPEEKSSENSGEEKLLKCEFCGKMGPTSKFRNTKRFCTISCAKRYNVGCAKRMGPLFKGKTSRQAMSSKKRNKRKPFGWTRDAEGRVTTGPIKRHSEESSSMASSGPEFSSADEGDQRSSSISTPPLSPPPPVLERQEEVAAPPVAELNPPPAEDEVAESSKEEPDIDFPARRTHPSQWTVVDVYDFIMSLPGCEPYAEEFRGQEIDGQALMLLKEDHLMQTMGMKLGPALKICAKITSLKEELS